MRIVSQRLNPGIKEIITTKKLSFAYGSVFGQARLNRCDSVKLGTNKSIFFNETRAFTSKAYKEENQRLQQQNMPAINKEEEKA